MLILNALGRLIVFQDSRYVFNQVGLEELNFQNGSLLGADLALLVQVRRQEEYLGFGRGQIFECFEEAWAVGQVRDPRLIVGDPFAT